MGVSGCGKSTIGKLLAQRLGWAFIEGDDCHPAPNIDKMRRGEALDDADRLPWLTAIAAAIARRRQAAQPAVIACSALGLAHREILQGGHPDVLFLLLKISQGAAAARIAQRQAHFMPASLLASQFARLEEPAPSGDCLVVDATSAPEIIVSKAAEALARSKPE